MILNHKCKMLTLGLFCMLAIYYSTATTINNAIDRFHCTSRYSDAFFIDESTLTASSNQISTCEPSRSILECSASCDPSASCAGVVYHREECCKVTDGTTLRTSAVSREPDLPQVMLYDDSVSPVVCRSIQSQVN